MEKEKRAGKQVNSQWVQIEFYIEENLQVELYFSYHLSLKLCNSEMFWCCDNLLKLDV